MTAEDYAGELYDLLASAPHGLTRPEVCALKEWDPSTFNKAVRALRLILSADDTLFVRAEPGKMRAPWLYELVDASTLVDQESSQWIPNRLGDAESRIVLLQSSMAAATRATDGRRMDGKKARLLERGLRHLAEDLEALTAGE